jgi:hypothetical protein
MCDYEGHCGSDSLSSGSGGGGQCGKNVAAQIGTGYIRVGRSNRQKENWATEDLMVTSRLKLQHGVNTHDIRKSIVTDFADTSSRWLHQCIP